MVGRMPFVGTGNRVMGFPVGKHVMGVPVGDMDSRIVEGTVKCSVGGTVGRR